ncbi:MAG TPA: LysE/ArgO family amino acid transporter [Thauera sp.]|uniref:LysE/ArgO family amino acid transporter n=1 Tax=Thauera sp. TaxID=1905334 RepID=UPI000FA2A96F|nr:LysE/ArgO family amino acid transporter [Thauera sp.]MCP5226303.1 amino acid transporter [Thauera sp.]RTL18486.1 MAG: amino acid transporter [Rhodocyclaceae bacterium]HPE04754.1 LysE/ArgO family amino acid transporter [Thauera sp.]HRV78724.1 LysE/ArgO family amino acid transporter [Thauera sp.]
MSNVYFNGFLLTLGLIMAIGAQNAHVLRQGLRGEHVLLTIGVSAACDILLIGLGIAGVGSLFVANPDLMTVARYGGAAFLVWYGTRALLSALRGGRALDLAEHKRMSRGQALLAAAGFSLLNPHAYLDTVVLLGSIGSQQAEDLRPLFAAGAISASIVWFLLLGYGARLLAPLFAKPVAWRVLDALVALMLWAIAASLLLA